MDVEGPRGIPETLVISCTIVMADSGSRPVTHKTDPIFVAKVFVAQRRGVNAISVPTLVTLLRQNAAQLPLAMQFALHSPTMTDIATTRVPFFGVGWEDSVYGYRRVTSIVPAAADISIPQMLQDTGSEIYAIDPFHERTIEYAQIWAITDLDPDTHFVLILSETANLQFAGIPVIPASDPVEGIRLLPGTTPAHAITAPATFATLASRLGLSLDEIASARYQGKPNLALTGMVRNWNAAQFVITRFGVSLDSPRTGLSGNPTLNELLVELGWSESSYRKKTLWYEWAGHAATQVWHPSEVPGETSNEFRLYRTWKSIVFLWKAGGPIATGREPAKTSADPEEREAALLTQTMMEAAKKKLSKLLVDCE
ncbi:hypothetical protein B0H15DRAFT_958160 [Mycena belliarum]|uniref:Uncharacterized protein n=1 Tax=Mycena belliarum TaxID=1033014 RepID=A0AAD6XHV3_9AGAR|nr:hypothetical protein B0H15DRAFT_958160 [Mycena belliae]